MPSPCQQIIPPEPLILKAWYLFTILVRNGRPLSIFELASRSELDSVFISPDLVELLCQISGSPICLTANHFVSISEFAYRALDRFSNPEYTVPRVLTGFWERVKIWNGLRVTINRRKRSSDFEVVERSPKRRHLLNISEKDVECRKDDKPGIAEIKIKDFDAHKNLADAFAENLFDLFPSNVNQGIASTSLDRTHSCFMENFEIGNANHIHNNVETGNNCDNTSSKDQHDNSQENVQNSFCYDAQVIIDQKEVPQLFGNDGSLNTVPDSVDGIEQPLLWFETLGDDTCIIPAAPLPLRNEVDSASHLPLEDAHDTNKHFNDFDDLFTQLAENNDNYVCNKIKYRENERIALQDGNSWIEQDIYKAKVPTPSESESVKPLLMSETNLQQQNASEKQMIMNFQFNSSDQKSVHDANVSRKSPKGKRPIKNEKCATKKEKVKTRLLDIPLKENKQETTHKVSKTSSESKSLPQFESFIIEEEEGSGGYGTVYRARRKDDDKIVAVKCPHPNAHFHHVSNELKMLKRFGGRNYVIKHEGSFKFGQSECSVLEHFSHDRPEALRKEIDIFELQWYGYCMFKALTSLHKQGVVHRDVKPGNFLFSRKSNKGYLIDFNLATDMHHKFSKSSKSRNTSQTNPDPSSFPITESNTCNQGSSTRMNRIFASMRKETANDANKNLPKNIKRKSTRNNVETLNSIDGHNKHGSQTADSGLTSTKDPVRTRSADGRAKPPIVPSKGRKELINFIREEMQSPKNVEMSGPVSQRKRIAAPSGKMNDKLIIPTPMPLLFNGSAIAGAGLISDGKEKARKEGPCVGTKGFRAPEVLLKSFHQSCKIDVWSAGVTLLYMIIGKAPFCGDPEQNIKEIAKLRGSESLWEVAKLHNCESSYPPDLYDVKYLQSMELREWCVQNTKRPELIELIPRSLFDLIDKCLTVNPRQRISAEEALMHKFFISCHESLKKQRLLRRASESESGSQTL